MMFKDLKEKWKNREVWSDTVSKKMIVLLAIGWGLPAIIMKLIGVAPLSALLYSACFVSVWIYIGVFHQDKLESH